MLLTLPRGAEDALLTLATLPDADATREAVASIRADLRGVLNTSATLFGRVLLAASYDTALINEVMVAEEPIPGVSLAQLRAIHAQSAALKEESGRKATRESTQVRLRRQQFAAASATAASLPPAGQLALPAPVPAPHDGKAVYACHACNVKGHWKGDGKCRPEDVRAHLARLSTLVGSGALREPATPGTSGSGTELILSLSVICVCCNVIV
jgi:hypothetical protein